jgi:RimJ/RimL family protein N-acetyltransferase
MKVVCETDRLTIRHFNLNDTEFIIRLLNEESFIHYIADKNVRTSADALNYLTNGPISSYQNYELGLSLVLLKGTETAIGMCGLLKREELDYPDLGFAFLPEFWGKGYAKEAASSVIKKSMVVNPLSAVLAVTLPDNISSNGLLKKIGFCLKGTIEIYGSQSNLYEYSA